MTDFGTRLKQAREQRGISQRQIAAATKISTAALEALERNDFSRLPGGIFSRAFVRAYTLEVGLDPETTVQEFLVEYEQNYTAQSDAAAPEITADDRAFLERQQRAARWLRGVSIALVVVLAALVVAWRVAGARRAESEAETKSTPPASSTREAAALAPVANAEPDPVPAAPGGAGVASPTTAATPPAVAPAAPVNVGVDQVAVKLQITGECWVRVTVDGAVQFDQTLGAGDSRDIKPGRDVYLQVGNAGAVRWSINGQPAKPMGNSGQTAAIRVNKTTAGKYLGL